jgi:hypothetical protein
MIVQIQLSIVAPLLKIVEMLSNNIFAAKPKIQPNVKQTWPINELSISFIVEAFKGRG